MSAEIISLFDIQAQREMLAAAAREKAAAPPEAPRLSPRELLFYRNLTFFGRILSDPTYGQVGYKLHLLESTHEPVAEVTCGLYRAYFYVMDGMLLDFKREPIIVEYDHALVAEAGRTYAVSPQPKLEPYHE